MSTNASCVLLNTKHEKQSRRSIFSQYIPSNTISLKICTKSISHKSVTIELNTLWTIHDVYMSNIHLYWGDLVSTWWHWASLGSRISGPFLMHCRNRLNLFLSIFSFIHLFFTSPFLYVDPWLTETRIFHRESIELNRLSATHMYFIPNQSVPFLFAGHHVESDHHAESVESMCKIIRVWLTTISGYVSGCRQ